MDTAANIVSMLLEDEDPKDFIAAMGSVDLSGVSPQQVKVFRQKVRGYVKWLMDTGACEPDQAVLDQIKASTTFDEVLAILRAHEDPETPFLDMIAAGYF